MKATPEIWRELAKAVFGERFRLAEEYAARLADQGIVWGLLGPREVDRLWERHIINSLCLSPLLPERVQVADLGSGAGLPGLVLAIARPDLTVDLVEPMKRRRDFLALCVERLGLGEQVAIVAGRAQEYLGGAPILVCRALASVAGLLEMVDALVPPAELLAVKGERAASEVVLAEKELARRGLQAAVVQPFVGGQVVGTVVRVCQAEG